MASKDGAGPGNLPGTHRNAHEGPDPRVAEALALARAFRFVREAGANRGRWVEALIRIGGTVPGQPWCACFVMAVLGLVFQGKPPFSYSASCDVLLAEARRKKMTGSLPAPGALFFVMAANGNPDDAEHVGFVSEDIAAPKFGTIEGNASDPEAPPTREGFGVFERRTDQERCRRVTPRIVFVYWWL